MGPGSGTSRPARGQTHATVTGPPDRRAPPRPSSASQGGSLRLGAQRCNDAPVAWASGPHAQLRGLGVESRHCWETGQRAGAQGQRWGSWVPPQQLSLSLGAGLRGGGGHSSGAGEAMGAGGRARRRGCDSGDSSKDFRVFPPLGAVTLFVLSPHLGNVSYQGDPQPCPDQGAGLLRHQACVWRSPGWTWASQRCPWAAALPAEGSLAGAPAPWPGGGRLSCLSGAPAHWRLSGQPLTGPQLGSSVCACAF